MKEKIPIKRKVGRPVKKDRKNSHTRDCIINASRELFIKYPYSDVTIISIALLSGTNPALVRYYFISKENLYQEMLFSISDELKGYLKESNWQEAKTPVEPLMNAYIKIFKQKPSITKLVFRELLTENSKEKKKVLNCLFKPNAEFILKTTNLYFSEKYFIDDIKVIINFMVGVVFMYAFKESIEEAGAGDILPENYDDVIEDNIRFIESAYFDLYHKG